MKVLKIESIENRTDLFSEVFSLPTKHKANGFQAVNVIVGNPTLADLRLFFQPDEDTQWIKFDDPVQWPHVLKGLGIFKSNSQARKTGWDLKIESGWHEAMFKKQRKIIFLFKMEED